MATGDWLDLRGWVEGLVGWSMDNVHDTLPSKDLDLTVTISLPRGIWPEDILLGRVVNLQNGFADMQPALEEECKRHLCYIGRYKGVTHSRG